MLVAVECALKAKELNSFTRGLAKINIEDQKIVKEKKEFTHSFVRRVEEGGKILIYGEQLINEVCDSTIEEFKEYPDELVEAI